MTGVPVAALELVGTDYLNEVARAHWRKTTAKTISNSIVETDLLNGEIAIDAGAMSTARALRLTALGDWKQNSGAVQDLPTFKLKLGATTIFSTSNIGANVVGNSAGRWPWRFVIEIENLGAANAQWVSMDGYVGHANNSIGGANNFATGEGLVAAVLYAAAPGAVHSVYKGVNSAAVDTTVANVLQLTATLPVANANVDMVLKSAIVEVV